MKSALPKVLHTVAGRPLIYYPIAALLEAGVDHVVAVVGHGREAVRAYLEETFGSRIGFAVQEPQRGTGHAVQQAFPSLPGDTQRVLVAYGDTPLLVVQDLRALASSLDEQPSFPLAIVTCRIDDPTGYGRILRDSTGTIREVREQKDLRSTQEREIREVNPGLYCAKVEFLREAVFGLEPNNAQKEYYLTDIIAQAASRGGVIGVPGDAANLLGINDRAQLSAADDVMYRRIADRHRRAGATIRQGVLIEETVVIEPDAVIESYVSLRGKTRIGSGARVDVGSVITDATIASGAFIKPYSVIGQSQVGKGAQIGPFAHLRPDSVIGDEAHVGNFVETKKTVMHPRSKANHLAYLGDGDVGEGANVGAGTIFCNYDGFQKHRTVIGKGAFIGSDSQLVAPVTIGDNAYVGTGSTVTENVPAESLAIARARQTNKDNYAPILRERLAAAAKAAKAKKQGGQGPSL